MGRKSAVSLAGLLVVLIGVAATGCSNKKKTAPVSYVNAEEQYRRALEQLGEDHLNQAKNTLQAIQYTPEDDRRTIEPLDRLVCIVHQLLWNR